MPARMPRVYLIRHGETEWSLNGRHTGVTDIPLTAKGEQMVLDMSPRMIGPGKLIQPEYVRNIIISPRARAARTAELLFGEHKPPKANITTDAEVSEWDYGAYEGLLSSEIAAHRPGWSIWNDGCPAGETPGESPQEISDRVDRVIARVRAIHSAYKDDALGSDDANCADVLIFSHGHFSRCFIARWCDLPVQTGYHLCAEPGGLAVLGYQHRSLNEPSLLGLNWYTEDALAKR
ncbi:hypothetical protein L202_03150 [Cryptococcus amylolentus CBS 6039]|uniref:Phosphoglycerate mutase n=2 Tax=Cryptococcus amylolentus TaxID=104669 RepID=A0A1E3HXI6_9TREE|nr:hypothetical protein L202_03150 [Cryptococcus amylolentus CBS 6039]ODN81053.1 hypothetical protein L202_03150 [Cryptococcus amylolentus CBS 6039]ODO09514.1 hypothetical protein I350_03117 [Cryptococcus amylolentus CBS 6273]